MAVHPPKLKALVIEDRSEVAAAIEMLLHHAGFEIVVAKTGAEAVQISRHREFDLVTLDVDLPDMKGFDVCVELKKDFRFVRTPVIFISGRSSGEDRRRAFESGAADFILKPFDATVLVSQILSLVKPRKNQNI